MRVAVRHVRGNCGSRDVDRVLAAVTGHVTDVQLFLTAAAVSAAAVVAGRGRRRGRGRSSGAEGGRSLVLPLRVAVFGLRLLVVRGLSFTVAGGRVLCRSRLGLGRARGRLALRVELTVICARPTPAAAANARPTSTPTRERRVRRVSRLRTLNPFQGGRRGLGLRTSVVHAAKTCAALPRSRERRGRSPTCD